MRHLSHSAFSKARQSCEYNLPPFFVITSESVHQPRLTLKSKKPLIYPINHGIASCYGHAKGTSPANDLSIAKECRRKFKWLNIGLAISAAFFALSLVIFFSFKSEAPHYGIKSKDEAIGFTLGIPVCITLIITSLVCLNYFECWNERRRALRRVSEFNRHYDLFLSTLRVSRDEISAWPEEQIKRICVATLESERTKVDGAKTARSKAARLRKFIDIYEKMTSMGIRFNSVGSYIEEVKQEIKLKSKSKPRKKKSAPKRKSKKKKTVLEPAA